MPNQPFLTWNIPGGIAGMTARTYQTQVTEVINVKDFGAIGNGIVDDTVAIQAALNAAFGSNSGTGFNGLTNVELNKMVFFPGGVYLVSSPQLNRSITNITCDTSVGPFQGHLTYTTSVNHGYLPGQLVYVEGVTGNNEGNGSREIASVTLNTFTTVSQPRFVTYTGGGTVHTPALYVKGVYGGRIFGAGKQAPQILNETTGGIVFQTNGWRSSVVEGLCFGSNTAVAYAAFVMDLDADSVNTNGIQGTCFDSFNDCWFSGTTIGVTVAPTLYSQGDTVTFYNCIFNQCTTGCEIGANGNGNAINISFFGGEFISGGTGISCGSGSVGVVSGSLFTGNTVWDMNIQSAGESAVSVLGVTTESANFLKTNQCIPHISGCDQRQGASGTFLEAACAGSIIDSVSRAGIVLFQDAGSIIGSQFQSSAAIGSSNTSYNQKPVYVENCSIGGTFWGPTSGLLFPNYSKGFFQNINNAQYYIGRRIPCTTIGTSVTYTDQVCADLPSSGAVSTFKGIQTTVYDSTTGVVGTVLTSSMGGGTTAALVFCDGTSSGWKIIGA